MIIAFNEVPGSAAAKTTPSSDALVNALLSAFSAAVPGSIVWGSVFHWSDADFTGALRRIVEERRLELRVVAGDRDHSIPREVRDFFRRCVRQGGVHRVRPLERRNHDKWFLFERLDFSALETSAPANSCIIARVAGVDHGLWISTANLSSSDRLKNNAAILIRVDRSVVALLKRRFDVLRWLYRIPRLLVPLARLWFRRAFDFVEYDGQGYKLYLFPGAGVRDIVLECLESVEPPATIRICANRWNRATLAQALFDKFQKSHAATRIEIITRSPDDWYDLDEDGIYEAREMTPAVAELLRRCSARYFQRHARDPETGALVTRLGVNLEGNSIEVPVGAANIHSKYILIQQAARSSVLIGSPNLVKGAIGTSFETLLLLKNDPLAHRAFQQNFERLKTPIESGGLGATDPELVPDAV